MFLFLSGRIYKKVGSQSAEHYILDGDQTVAVYENGAVKYWNILANGVAGRQAASGEKFYYLKDHLGSTRAVVDAAGTVKEALDYYPFGLLMPGRTYQIGSATKEKFTGKERDAETGLNYHGGRYYWLAGGRWVEVDPLAEKFPGWSPYNYTLNNSVNLFDPDGNAPFGRPIFSPFVFYLQVIRKNLFHDTPTPGIDYTVFLENIEGKSLKDVMHEHQRGQRLDYSAGGPDPRYRYVTDPGGSGRTIDMRHFLVVGQHGRLTGVLVEFEQLFRGVYGSAFKAEDFFSNYMGSLFFNGLYFDPKTGKWKRFYDPNSKQSLKDQLQFFFEWWKTKSSPKFCVNSFPQE